MIADHASRSPALPSSRGGRFDSATVATLAGAHMVHDAYPAFVGILLPSLMGRLDIGLATGGLLATGIRWTTLLQPLVGHLADRRDTRRWVALAPAATAILVSSVVIAPSFTIAFALLLGAGVSHAFFHPAAGALVTRVAEGRWGRAAGWFMTGGELGRAIGPLFIAAVVAAVGFEQAWIALLPGVAIALAVTWRVRRLDPAALRGRVEPIRSALGTARAPLVLLSGSIVLRAFATVAFLVFYPSYALDHGATLVEAGLVVAGYELAGAAGVFGGGILSDRIGRPLVLAGGLGLGIPAMLAGLAVPPGPLQAGLLAVAGLWLLSGMAVQVVQMQELLPHNRSSAVGLVYLMTTSGAIVTTVAVGGLGQAAGLSVALPIAIVTAILGLPLLVLMAGTLRSRPASSLEAEALSGPKRREAEWGTSMDGREL